MRELLHKIQKWWIKLRLQPIRVFCFHQVSEQYDPSTYTKADWIALSEFKDRINDLKKKGYVFISMQEAYKRIMYDTVRTKKYAVLTCDDGLKCQVDIIPWLKLEEIPITMFVTAKYLDGETCAGQILSFMGIKDKQMESVLARKLYITKEELLSLDCNMVEIGYHGYEHVDVSHLEPQQIQHDTYACIDAFKNYKNVVPFYAYPFGRHSLRTDNILMKNQLVPVYIDGLKNYNDHKRIHRELL